MQNKVRIFQWSNIRMTSNYLHWPAKFGTEPRKFAWRIHMLQVRNNSERVPTCKNRISLMQVTCGWLPLGKLFLFGFVLHSTFMSSTDEKSGQRFIPEAPNLNPLKGFQCMLDHGINKVHSDALLIWKAISTIQSSIAYCVIRGQEISVSSIAYCQI